MTCPHCGGKPPSDKQHRRMMLVFSLAFTHWPESSSFRPRSMDDLRGWLAVQAGYSKTKTVKFRTAGREFEAAYLALRSMQDLDDTYSEIFGDEGQRTITRTVPRSMSYNEMTHKERCAYFPKMEDIISDEIGIKDCNELLEMAKVTA